MTQSKKVQFQIRKQDVIVELVEQRKGVYWSYPDTLLTAGPLSLKQLLLKMPNYTHSMERHQNNY